MKVIIYYIIIGVIIMFLVEAINHAYENHLKLIGEKSPKFNMFERIIGILTWPIIIAFFIKNLKN